MLSGVWFPLISVRSADFTSDRCDSAQLICDISFSSGFLPFLVFMGDLGVEREKVLEMALHLCFFLV